MSVSAVTDTSSLAQILALDRTSGGGTSSSATTSTGSSSSSSLESLLSHALLEALAETSVSTTSASGDSSSDASGTSSDASGVSSALADFLQKLAAAIQSTAHDGAGHPAGPGGPGAPGPAPEPGAGADTTLSDLEQSFDDLVTALGGTSDSSTFAAFMKAFTDALAGTSGAGYVVDTTL